MSRFGPLGQQTFKSETSRHNAADFHPNFLVTIYSACHGAVVCKAPEEFQMQLASEWDTPLTSGKLGLVDVALQEGLNISTKTQLASAQVWAGSAPIDITIPLEFYAQQDPYKEVVLPILRLAKMALPREGTQTVGGVTVPFLTPPGPRVLKLGKGKAGSDQITINIGRFFNFRDIIVVSVNPKWVIRDMTSSGYPLKATCEITFRSMFTLTGGNLESMFLAPGRGNNTSQNGGISG